MKQLFTLFVALVLAGCTSLLTPDTYQQRLAYAASSVTASRATCADHFLRGAMSRANAEKCLTLTDQATKMIDTARLQPTGSEAELAAALAVLTQVEALLKDQEKR